MTSPPILALAQSIVDHDRLNPHASQESSPSEWEDQLARAVLAMWPLVEAGIAMRETESIDVPGESIAELEANVPAAQRRTALALFKWRAAVDTFRKENP